MDLTQKRKMIVDRIVFSLQKLRELNRELDEEALIDEIVSEYGCLRNTAKQYVETARTRMRTFNTQLSQEEKDILSS